MIGQVQTKRHCRNVAALFLSLFFTLATAGRASHNCHSAFVFRRIPPLDQELGSSPTLSRVIGKDNYYFDPLELASDENFARFRECELKHGRVAMLATLGMIAPAIFRRDTSLTCCKVVKSLTLSQYIQILATCAFLEAFVFVQIDPKDMPGDYGTGYFGLRDKGKNERYVDYVMETIAYLIVVLYSSCGRHCNIRTVVVRSMISELENGRLAMLAFVVQVLLELITKKGIVEQWEGILIAIGKK